MTCLRPNSQQVLEPGRKVGPWLFPPCWQKQICRCSHGDTTLWWLWNSVSWARVKDLLLKKKRLNKISSFPGFLFSNCCCSYVWCLVRLFPALTNLIHLFWKSARHSMGHCIWETLLTGEPRNSGAELQRKASLDVLSFLLLGNTKLLIPWWLTELLNSPVGRRKQWQTALRLNLYSVPVWV